MIADLCVHVLKQLQLSIEVKFYASCSSKLQNLPFVPLCSWGLWEAYYDLKNPQKSKADYFTRTNKSSQVFDCFLTFCPYSYEHLSAKFSPNNNFVSKTCSYLACFRKLPLDTLCLNYILLQTRKEFVCFFILIEVQNRLPRGNFCR